MNLTVTGKYVRLIEDPKAVFVVLDVPGGAKPNVAVRCWSNILKAKARALQPGATVKVDGELASREWNGKWYTDFEAIELTGSADGPPPLAPEDDPPF